MLFAKYDLDHNRELDEDELKRMFEDLEGKKKQLEKQIESEQKRPMSAAAIGFGASADDVNRLVRRVDRMEYTLSLIAAKIDSVLEGRIILPKSGMDQDKEEALANWEK